MGEPIPGRSRTARVIDVADPGTPAPSGRKTYRCEVHLYPRNGSGYLAVAAALPAVAAVGSTEGEALAEVTKLFAEAIRNYTAGGGSVPWFSAPPDPYPGGEVRVVFPQV